MDGMSDRYVYAEPPHPGRSVFPVNAVRLTGDWNYATTAYRYARYTGANKTDARNAAIVALVTNGGTARGGYWSIPRH